MDNNKKGIIAVAISLGVVGLAYFFLVHKSGSASADSVETTFNDNFNSLMTNTGKKPNKDNVLTVNLPSFKILAQFYTNNRVMIFGTDKNFIARGTYSDGGKTIKLDSGKEITSGSVYDNVLQASK